jgi:hypothetical protein
MSVENYSVKANVVSVMKDGKLIASIDWKTLTPELQDIMILRGIAQTGRNAAGSVIGKEKLKPSDSLRLERVVKLFDGLKRGELTIRLPGEPQHKQSEVVDAMRAAGISEEQIQAAMARMRK